MVMADTEPRAISNQEAINRIREGLHADFAEHGHPFVDAEVIQWLEDGKLRAAIRDNEDGSETLCFMPTES